MLEQDFQVVNALFLFKQELTLRITMCIISDSDDLSAICNLNSLRRSKTIIHIQIVHIQCNAPTMSTSLLELYSIWRQIEAKTNNFQMIQNYSHFNANANIHTVTLFKCLNKQRKIRGKTSVCQQIEHVHVLFSIDLLL